MSRKTAQTSVSSARQAAFDILLRVRREAAYASPLIAAVTGLSREDRGLVQELTLGTLRWQGTIDHIIRRYSQRPIEKLDPAVLIALRLGIYQLRYLTRIPPRAAVHESVDLVKTARVASPAPMVNAVLRRVARDPEAQPDNDLADPIDRLAVECSHPRWLIERWIAELGPDEARMLALADNVA